jgi:UPF0042 nucleotide-binding protein
MTNSNLQLVIITGMSGAGKTVAMQSLEDAGFYCVDNLPPQLIPTFSTLVENSANQIKHVALAIDLRTIDFLEALPKALEEIEQIQKVDYQMVFLDASEQILVQRYKQSRRLHPMASEDAPLSGIVKEKKLLKELQEKADIVIDTTSLKPAQLKEKMMKNFDKKDSKMMVNVMSFGFKYGIPLDADLVFDVRFLPNPHYIDTLRPKTGKESDVANYVFDSDKTKAYMEKLIDFISFSLPQYKEEGKQQLVIAIGCTGGKHRSVAITEKLGTIFGKDYTTFTSHRDIGRE